ncbi:patatin-like phospholipase family protein [Bradyrhizobium sp. USDA 4520]
MTNKRRRSHVRRGRGKSRHSACQATWLALSLTAFAVLPGCAALSERAAIPEGSFSTTHLEGLPQARFWGDEVTPQIKAVIAQQYGQVRKAALAGVRPRSPAEAHFLAISGGGADGAFAAGFLKGWSKRGDRPSFEVVTGVSTGALAAPFAFLGEAYDQQLQEIYTVYGDQDLYSSRGLLGLVGNGIYDSAPLRGLISRYMTDDVLDAIAGEYHLGRRLLVQTTNLDAQRPVIWDLTAICASKRPDRRDLIVSILLASAAIPGVFPPVRIHVVADDGQQYDELHVDGGVVGQVFFAPPKINLAENEIATFGKPRSRTIYVIRNGRLRPTYELTQDRFLDITKRSIDSLIRYQGVSDLNRLQRLAQVARAKLFYTSIPPSFKASPKSEFDTAYMRQLFDEGVADGYAGKWMRSTPETPILADFSRATN